MAESVGGTISINDLSQLNYLDMCVKDVLRVSPIAPFIMRQPYENFEIGIVRMFIFHRNIQLDCFRRIKNSVKLWYYFINNGCSL